MIGIYALAQLGEKLMVKDNSVFVTLAYEGGQNQLSINSGNSMILQKQIVS